jgi:uncharacterized caspase-like protein
MIPMRRIPVEAIVRPLAICLLVLCLLIPSNLLGAQDEGQRWAVLIGVNEYTKLRNLQFCVADARRMRDQLVEGGFPAENVFLLVDKANRQVDQPFRENILDRIRAVLQAAGKNDLVLVMFSGHGVHLDGTSYFCPTESDLKNPQNTMVPLDLIYLQLEASEARHKLLLVDACRNDPRRDGERDALAHQRDLQGLAEQLKALPKGKGILALSSAAAGQISWECDKLGHGVFTNYVMEGLSGEADIQGNRDGVVSLLELYNYANVQTRRWVLNNRPDSIQTPELYGRIGEDYSLGVSPLVTEFTVREADQSGPAVEGATVELRYRAAEGMRPESLASEQTDANGRVQLAVRLSPDQRAKGRFAVTVRRGDATQYYTLDRFLELRNYPLYVPPVAMSPQKPGVEPPAAAPPTELVAPIDLFDNLAEQSLGNHPRGWTGSDFVTIGRWEGVPSLRCNAVGDYPHVLESPALNLGGDFFVQIELAGEDIRNADVGIRLRGTNGSPDVLAQIARRGHWNLQVENAAQVTQQGVWAAIGVPVNLATIFRLERRGRVYSLTCLAAGSEPATWLAPDAGDFTGIALEFRNGKAEILRLDAGPLAPPAHAAQGPFKRLWQFDRLAEQQKDWTFFSGAGSQIRCISPALNIAGDFAVQFVLAGVGPNRGPESGRFQLVLGGFRGTPDVPIYLSAHRGQSDGYLPGAVPGRVETRGASVTVRIEREGDVLRLRADNQLLATSRTTGVGGLGWLYLDCYSIQSWTIKSLQVDAGNP